MANFPAANPSPSSATFLRVYNVISVKEDQMAKKYVVRLEADERRQLDEFCSKGRRLAQLIRRARVLLLADVSDQGPGLVDERIAEAAGVSVRSIEMLRRRFVEEGLEACLRRKEPRHLSLRRKLDGEKEAQLVAISCSAPPAGRTRWTLRLLADRLVQLHVVDSVSYETVRRTLKKNDLKPWRRKMWCIPPEQNAAFVAAMENVLEVYKRPYNPLFPVVCMDEGAKQLVAETRTAMAMSPGQPMRYDYEYTRNGMCNIYMLCQPHSGWRRVAITTNKTAVAFAHQVRQLLDRDLPDAKRVTMVLDNYTTHTAGALYQAFEPEEARRLLDRLELVCTPKHGSWLNMAEIELSALARQCTEGRIGDRHLLDEMVAAWEKDRNHRKIEIDWQFKTDDARIKLRRLYPKIAA